MFDMNNSDDSEQGVDDTSTSNQYYEESDESLFWLEFIADLELMHKKLLEDLIKEANEFVSIFTAALKTLKTNKKHKIPIRNSHSYALIPGPLSLTTR